MSRPNKCAGVLLVGMLLLAFSTWAAAPAGRYTVNEQAGTVLDTKTGLTWQRAVSASTYTGNDAASYCKGLDLGGFSSGWQLPTKRELETLVDVRVGEPGPTIDTTAFPATPAERFWTTSNRAGYAGKGWSVDFGDGGTRDSDTSSAYRVRCVR